MGPTGIGKSALAVALAERVPAEIVSVDSVMVYRGMDIGTAKPTPAERARVPHHLLDIRDPAEPYSAAEFAHDARAVIGEILGRARLPILVGGTFLYFRALIDGLSPMPPADPDVRETIRERARREGWSALHRELAALDPETTARIHAHDRQRLERALELYRLSGEPPSRLHAEAGERADFDFRKCALLPEDRSALDERLESRFVAMLEQGLVEEVRALYGREDLHRELPALRSVGYSQMLAWLAGDCGYDEASRRAVVATRRYAKRQLTWLRRERDCSAIRVDARDSEPWAPKALKQIYEQAFEGASHAKMNP
ncbi:MAG: tRNA (adenosine(37)-N6)-dimethylallyltransferase MiaA [Gammaproteobacteria bacterium]|nr:tRNA (adenosine(37)-N6)-dimethylallyltransferase MiaA [Gammaproteobacteria bacterium]